MRDFDHLLNWTLQAGSHEFPGPDGGTCINEAAVVAAGFAYRKIDNVESLPKCFSPVLSSFAMEINDSVLHDDRQKLMPFVMRLAGARDKAPVENARAEFIFARWIDRVLPVLLDAIGLPEQAALLRRKQSLEAARRCALRAAKMAFDLVDGRKADPQMRSLCLVTAITCERAATVRSLVRGNLIVCPASLPLFGSVVHMTDEVYLTALSRHGIWDISIDILDQALLIGRQAAPVEVAEIKRRFNDEQDAARVREEDETIA